MNELIEKTIATEQVFNGRMIDLQIDTVTLPNGATATREIIRHPGAVAILAITADKKMVFVEQYRKPIERVIFEIPAGKIDVGETDHLLTAQRELEEETTCRATNWQLLISFYTAPGFADEIIHIYEARGLAWQEAPLAMDADEFLNVHTLTLTEAKALIGEGKIVDAKTVYAIQHFELNYNNY